MRSPSNKKKKVILANDNTFLLQGFSAQLREANLDVETVEDGIEALELLKRDGLNYYDAVILDINMPKMGGIQTAIQIEKMKLKRRQNDKPCLFFLSADNFELYQQQLQGINYVAFFTQLFNNEIEMIVERLS